MDFCAIELRHNSFESWRWSMSVHISKHDLFAQTFAHLRRDHLDFLESFEELYAIDSYNEANVLNAIYRKPKVG